MTYEELDKFLSEYNIQLMCFSPLEIKDMDTGSIATGNFAELIIENLKQLKNWQN